MSADFNKPTVSNDYAGIPEQIRDNIDAAVTAHESDASSNKPVGAKQITAAGVLNRWNGSAWVEIYDPADFASGGDLSTHEGLTGTSVHGLGTAATAATGDFAPSSHVGSAATSAHSGLGTAAATTLVTTVGATGSDSNVPSEQAVREAIAAIPAPTATPAMSHSVLTATKVAGVEGVASISLSGVAGFVGKACGSSLGTPSFGSPLTHIEFTFKTSDSTIKILPSTSTAYSITEITLNSSYQTITTDGVTGYLQAKVDGGSLYFSSLNFSNGGLFDVLLANFSTSVS